MSRPSVILDAQSRPIHLRPETEEDHALVVKIYSTMLVAQLMIEVTEINEEQFWQLVDMQVRAQRHHYDIYYPEAEYSILMRDDPAQPGAQHPIGRLIVAPMEKEILLADIMILPEHKRQGTCSAVMDYYVAEGLRSDRRVRLSVEKWNDALHLYQKHGFTIVSEIPSHYSMEYGAAPLENAATPAQANPAS